MFKQKAIVNAINLDELAEAKDMINKVLLEKVEARIQEVKSTFRLLEDEVIKEEEDTEYQKFFKKTLKKFKVDSPADFDSDEKKKEFFDYIDKEWKGDKEED